MIKVAGIIEASEKQVDEHGLEYVYGKIAVERQSGILDHIHFRYPADTLTQYIEGDRVELSGNLRTYKLPDGAIPRSRTEIFVRTATWLPSEIYEFRKGFNEVVQQCKVLSKADRVRTTPNGMRILDVALLVRRHSGNTDKINAIVFGAAAIAFEAQVAVGTEIEVMGRLQSRVYNKQISEEESVTATITELAVSKWEAI